MECGWKECVGMLDGAWDGVVGDGKVWEGLGRDGRWRRQKIIIVIIIIIVFIASDSRRQSLVVSRRRSHHSHLAASLVSCETFSVHCSFQPPPETEQALSLVSA